MVARSWSPHGLLRPFSSPDFICSLDKFKYDTNGVAVWSWEFLCSVMHMFLGVYRNECLISKELSNTLCRCLFLALLLAQMLVF